MTILQLEPAHDDALQQLESFATVVWPDDLDAAEKYARSAAVHAIITRGTVEVRKALIDLCPDLKVIARVGIGLDNIDVDYAADRGVMVTNAPGGSTLAAAEHTILLMSALCRGLLPIANAVKAGDWAARNNYHGDDLADKSLGIVGMGAIGQRVSKLADAFDMKVSFWNRSAKDLPYPQIPLDKLLSESDVVALTIALTPATRGLIGSKEIATMKPGVLLVNTARGAVVDQEALVVALRSGQVGGYAADVLVEEPPRPDEPLLQFDNVVLTSHVATLTESTYRRTSLRVIGNVIALLKGEAIAAGDIANR